MPDQPEVVAAFSGTAANMLQQARNTHAILTTEDMTAFSNFSALYTPTWAANWLAAIDAAEAMPTDKVIIDQQAGKTTDVSRVMADARDKWEEIKYFIEEAFPGNTSKLNEFGGNDYMRIRRSQEGMQQFLTDLHGVASSTENKPALLAAGYTQARIDEIATLSAALHTKNTSQNTFIKRRSVLSRDRILALNGVYRTLTRVNAAGQIIFKANAAKRAQYVFDPAGEHTDVHVYTGDVSPADTSVIVTLADYDATRHFSFENTGTVGITFKLVVSVDNPGSVNEVMLAGGATVTKTMGQLNASDTALTLLAQNDDAANTGTYRVTVED